MPGGHNIWGGLVGGLEVGIGIGLGNDGGLGGVGGVGPTDELGFPVFAVDDSTQEQVV